MISRASVKRLWTLNETACGETFAVSETGFGDMVGQCDCVLSSASGFLLGIAAGKAVEHFGYMWFQTRFDSFLFIERVVVAHGERRRRLATGMVIEALQWCRERGIESVVCLVHDRPPNPAGHAICRQLGFQAIEGVMLPSRDIVTMYQRSTAIATP